MPVEWARLTACSSTRQRFALSAAVLSILLTTAGCRSPKLLLEYKFMPGTTARYFWVIDTVTSIDSPTEQTTKRRHAAVDITESTSRSARGEMILKVNIRPRATRQDGKAITLPPPTTIDYQVGPHGRILKVFGSDLPLTNLATLDLGNLSSEARPPLSLKPVGLSDEWSAPLNLRGAKSSIRMSGTGRLNGFQLEDKRRLAEVGLQRSGKITSSEIVGKAQVNLTGVSRSTSNSLVDVDSGALYSTNYSSSSNFDVASAGGPTAKLSISLTSRMKLESSSRSGKN